MFHRRYFFPRTRRLLLLISILFAQNFPKHLVRKQKYANITNTEFKILSVSFILTIVLVSHLLVVQIRYIYI